MGMAFSHPTSEKLLKLCDLLVAAGREDVIHRELGKVDPGIATQATQGSKDIFMM